jgi:glyoxylase-like metal-dependent hydrolase (beta-lactamase superfamily II)
MIEIEDEEPFLFIADTLHHPVHATHPEWDGGADMQPELALATRRAVLQELADRGIRTAASHVRGIQRVARDGDTHRFIPV